MRTRSSASGSSGRVRRGAAAARTMPATGDGRAVGNHVGRGQRRARHGGAAPTPPAAPAPAEAETDAATPPPSKGSWLEGNIYRFRLDDVRKCPPPSDGGGARIGAVVRVTSKIDEVFVAPRDFKLESGGVILDSAMLDKAPGGCGPLLAPKSLRAGKTADGVVVFNLPAGFNAEGRPSEDHVSADALGRRPPGRGAAAARIVVLRPALRRLKLRDRRVASRGDHGGAQGDRKRLKGRSRSSMHCFVASRTPTTTQLQLSRVIGCRVYESWVNKEGLRSQGDGTPAHQRRRQARGGEGPRAQPPGRRASLCGRPGATRRRRAARLLRLQTLRGSRHCAVAC